jgi:hypothetical protein
MDFGRPKPTDSGHFPRNHEVFWRLEKSSFGRPLFCVWLGLSHSFLTFFLVNANYDFGRDLAFRERPWEPIKRINAINDMQGRWVLTVYVLSCYYVVHVVFTLFAFLCASDAVSKVDLIVADAKLVLIAD